MVCEKTALGTDLVHDRPRSTGPILEPRDNPTGGFPWLVWVMSVLLPLPPNTFAQQPVPAQGDEAQLLKVLKSDATLFDKAKACQRLAVIGTAESVPVLAELLRDPQLSHYARLGLEANPGERVDEAFRQALDTLQGTSLVGVINSIGVRRDPQAVEALVKMAGDDNDEVAGAAIAALGSIGSAQSLAAVQQALSGRESLRVTAADACLTAADRLLDEGKNAAAAEVFAAVSGADLPKHLNFTSRFGELRSKTPLLEPDQLGGLASEYLAANDHDLFRIGLILARELKGAEQTQTLLAQLESLPPPRRILLLHVLGARGDVSALPAVLAATDSENPEIRLAAVQVLGTLRDGSALPALIKIAVNADEALGDVARESLTQLRGEDVDAAISDRIAGSSGRERAVLVELVGRRGISSAVPVLLSYVADDDAQLRSAAIDALGMTLGLTDLPPLIDRLLSETRPQTAESLKNALRKACQRVPDRDAAASMLLERMSRASAPAKAELMDLLIYVGGERALAGVGAAARSSDPAAADYATQALGKWLTPDAAPLLLDLAQNGNQQYRVRCLRGYIRIIRQFGLRGRQRLQMSQLAFKTATRDAERKLVLDTLTRFPSTAALNMVTPHLDNAALKQEASRVAVAIGEQIVNNDPRAVAAAMPGVLAATSDQQTAERAKVLLSRAQRK